jgi:hypothetical protein
MKRKFQLIETTCKRCGKKLLTGNRSLFGNDQMKAKLDRICYECCTPEELNIMQTLKPKI